MPSEKFNDATNNYTFFESWSKVKNQLVNGAFDESFQKHLKNIRSFYNETPITASDHSFHNSYLDIDNEMSSISRNLIFVQDSPRIRSFHQTLWSVPGMADFIYYGEDLITPYIRKERIIFPLGLPSSDGIQYVLKKKGRNNINNNNHNIMQDLAKELNRQQISYLQMQSSNPFPEFKYAYLHYNLLLACAVIGRPSRSACDDGFGTLRKGLIAEKSMAKCISLWLDERVRLSCGNAMAAAYSFAITYISERKHKAGPDELAPLCPIDEVLKACLQEILEDGVAQHHAATLIKMIANKPTRDKNPWDVISIKRKAEMAILLAEAITCSKGELTILKFDEYENDNDKDISKKNKNKYNKKSSIKTVHDYRLDKVLNDICSTNDSGLRMALWRAAANGKNLCAIGRLDSGRAFFQYLLMLYDLPVLLLPDKMVKEIRDSNSINVNLNGKGNGNGSNTSSQQHAFNLVMEYESFDDVILKVDVCDIALDFSKAYWPRDLDTLEMDDAFIMKQIQAKEKEESKLKGSTSTSTSSTTCKTSTPLGSNDKDKSDPENINNNNKIITIEMKNEIIENIHKLAFEKLESYSSVMEPERFVTFNKLYNTSANTNGNGGGGGGSGSGGIKKSKRKNNGGINDMVDNASAEVVKIASIKADQIAASLWEEEEREEKKAASKKKTNTKGKGGK
jgi:hypothetical protein